MFGLFKSKEDKAVDKLTKTLRSTKEDIYFDGNIVFDLATNINNRYKLTVSTIEKISNPGLLTPDIEDSGYVVIAISKNEAIYVNYERGTRRTRVQFVKERQDTLNLIQKIIETSSLKAEKGDGTVFKKSYWIDVVGAITILGYQVGIPEANEELYLPFNYKGNKFYIIDDDEGVWVVFEEKRKKEDMTYKGESHKENSKFGEDSYSEYGEDSFLVAIKKIKESEGLIYSLRLKFKTLEEADKEIKNLGIEYFLKNDMIYLIVDNKVYGILVDDDGSIKITGFDNDYNEIDFQGLKEGKYLGELTHS